MVGRVDHGSDVARQIPRTAQGSISLESLASGVSGHSPHPKIWTLTDRDPPIKNPHLARLPDKFGTDRKLATSCMIAQYKTGGFHGHHRSGRLDQRPRCATGLTSKGSSMRRDAQVFLTGSAHAVLSKLVLVNSTDDLLRCQMKRITLASAIS